MSFMNNMLNSLSDGTEQGDFGVIPFGGASDTVYLVNFIGNENCDRDPSVNDDWLTIVEAQEVCKEFKCSAKLFDASGQFQQGEIKSTGEYVLG